MGTRGIKTVIQQILSEAKTDSVIDRLRDDLKTRLNLDPGGPMLTDRRFDRHKFDAFFIESRRQVCSKCVSNFRKLFLMRAFLISEIPIGDN